MCYLLLLLEAENSTNKCQLNIDHWPALKTLALPLTNVEADCPKEQHNAYLGEETLCIMMREHCEQLFDV